MVLGHKLLHHRRQKKRLIEHPGAKGLAHVQGQNLTRPSVYREIHLILRQAPSGRIYGRFLDNNGRKLGLGTRPDAPLMTHLCHKAVGEGAEIPQCSSSAAPLSAAPWGWYPMSRTQRG